MKTFLYLFPILGVAVGNAFCDSDRILGGIPATVGQYPFIVSLRTLLNQHFCGGFVYNGRWIITTATCVQNREVQEFAAHLGTISRTGIVLTQRIERIEIHPEYHKYLVMNNIAMVRTAGIMIATGIVGYLPIGITNTPVGTSAVIMGWGRTSVGTEVPIVYVNDYLINLFFILDWRRFGRDPKSSAS